MGTRLTKLAKQAVGASIAAAAVPALMLTGAGNATAAPADSEVQVFEAAGGVDVFVRQLSVKNGWCTYTATPHAGSTMLPYTSLPFFLSPTTFVKFFIPAMKTGTQWTPRVTCDHGGNETTWPGAPEPITY